MSKSWDLRIDGDVLVYTAGFAADSRGGELAHSLYNVKLLINKYRKMFPGKCTVYLSSTDKSVNFRHTISDSYKLNRKDAKKPTYYSEIRQYMVHHWKALVCPWGEADDWLGVNSEKQTVIVSKDKDLLMLPNVYHYRMTTDKLIYATDPGQLFLSDDHKKLLGTGFAWFCAQMILGDTIDNIKKPAAGFGAVKVFEMFKESKTALEKWYIVQNHYEKNAENSTQAQELAIKTGKLLWISRKPRQIFSLEALLEVIQDETITPAD